MSGQRVQHYCKGVQMPLNTVAVSYRHYPPCCTTKRRRSKTSFGTAFL